MPLKICRMCRKMKQVSSHGLCMACAGKKQAKVITELRERKGTHYKRWVRGYQDALSHRLIGRPKKEGRSVGKKEDKINGR